MNITPAITMVRCLRTVRILQSYLDGETNESTAHRVAEHLQECHRCGWQAATYRAIKRAVRARAGDVDELALRRLHAFHRALANHHNLTDQPRTQPDGIDP
jgi:anti-sigma factor RsiW